MCHGCPPELAAPPAIAPMMMMKYPHPHTRQDQADNGKIDNHTDNPKHRRRRRPGGFL
jgi:hypothetical protein